MVRGLQVPQSSLMMDGMDDRPEEAGHKMAAGAVRRGLRDLGARRQADMAAKAGIDVQTLRDFLSGRRWPQYRTLEKLENALGWEPGAIRRIADVADIAAKEAFSERR